MVEVLNLNHPEPKVEREQVLKMVDLEELDLSDFWSDTENVAESYAHMIFAKFDKELP